MRLGVRSLLTNYHTHHYRCRHAKGQIEDYIKEAVHNGYTEIGVSCHVPFANFPEMGDQRMDYQDLSAYFQEIEAAQKKYPQIKILKSFECEYFPKVHDYLVWLAEKTDYLLLAGHDIEVDGHYEDAFYFTKPYQLEIYAQQIEAAMKTGLFKILAHPEIFMFSYPKWDGVCEQVTHKIAQAANQYDVILEVNANGFRYGRKDQPYPKEEFWSLIASHYPETNVLVNSDCHHPKFLNDGYMNWARQMAKRLKLNVRERL